MNSGIAPRALRSSSSFDDHDEEVVARLIATGDAVDRDYTDCVERHADPEFHSQAGFRFRMSGMYQLSQEELAELRRRVLAVVSFLNMPKKGGQGSKSVSEGADEPQGCNQAISITLEPLVGGLIPSPTIITSPRSKLDQWDGSTADCGGAPGAHASGTRGGVGARGRSVACSGRRSTKAVGAYHLDVRPSGVSQARGHESGRAHRATERARSRGSRRYLVRASTCTRGSEPVAPAPLKAARPKRSKTEACRLGDREKRGTP